MATWTNEGSQTETESSPDEHSSAFRNSGDFRKERCEAAAEEEEEAAKCEEERTAAAGGKEWREGERTINAIAAKKKAENRMRRSIICGEVGVRFDLELVQILADNRFDFD